jgi:flagellar basal-body rod protein FlgC
MSILSIAVSGLSAASLRVSVAASNIANARTTGPLPASGGSGTPAYVPLRVDQVTQSSGSMPGGTVATVSTVSPSFIAQFDPGAPFANQDGLVAAPNVDLVNEFVELEIAKYSFIANAKVIQAYAEMTDSLLDIT